MQHMQASRNKELYKTENIKSNPWTLVNVRGTHRLGRQKLPPIRTWYFSGANKALVSWNLACLYNSYIPLCASSFRPLGETKQKWQTQFERYFALLPRHFSEDDTKLVLARRVGQLERGHSGDFREQECRFCGLSPRCFPKTSQHAGGKWWKVLGCLVRVKKRQMMQSSVRQVACRMGLCFQVDSSLRLPEFRVRKVEMKVQHVQLQPEVVRQWGAIRKLQVGINDLT